MSIYCSVDEAWGPNFGMPANVQLGLPTTTHSDYLNNTGISVNNNASAVGGGVREPFFSPQGRFSQRNNNSGNSGREGFQNFDDYYQDDEQQRFAKVPGYKQKAFEGGGFHKKRDANLRTDYDEFNVPLVPGSYDDLERKPGKYHQFGIDPELKSELNFHDYDEEIQLHDQTECIDILKHLTHCEACRSKITNELAPSASASNNSNPQQSDDNNSKEEDVDVTEMALFISCGIFLIFLIDAIMKLGRTLG